MTSFIDTHTHLSTSAFDADRNDALDRAQAAGLAGFVAIGAAEGVASNHAALALAQSRPDVIASIGLHPHDTHLFSTEVLAELKALAAGNKAVHAWGEIGLDYHYMHAPKDTQQHAFEEQLLAAADLNLPVIIHTREAQDDTVAVLTRHRDKIAATVVHCFTGDAAFARALRDLDLYIGIGGVLTFTSAHAIREAVRDYPLDRLLLETDCPYLAPIPHRGRRNEPAYVPLIAERLAQVRGVPIEAIAEATTANARAFFRWE